MSSNCHQFSTISIKFLPPETTFWLGQRKAPFGWGSASDPLVGAAQATLWLWKKFIENFRPGNNSKTILENFEQLSKGKFYKNKTVTKKSIKKKNRIIYKND